MGNEEGWSGQIEERRKDRGWLMFNGDVSPTSCLVGKIILWRRIQTRCFDAIVHSYKEATRWPTLPLFFSLLVLRMISLMAI